VAGEFDFENLIKPLSKVIRRVGMSAAKQEETKKHDYTQHHATHYREKQEQRRFIMPNKTKFPSAASRIFSLLILSIDRLRRSGENVNK
jgi:hypothetical protein